MIIGVDVSHWNAVDDLWKYQDNDFVIAKLTEGKTMVDYTAFTYYLYARNFGQSFGVYHFAHPETNSVKQEFEHFQSNYHKFKDRNINIWLDVEAKALTLDDSKLDCWCDEFLKKAKELTTGVAGIYISQSQCKRFKLCKSYPLWVARYRELSKGYGDVSPWKEATIWQYNSLGVDKNIIL